MHRFSDTEIMEMIAASDEVVNDKALRYLYREYYGVMENMILKNNGSGADAEDIFQDALISFYNQVKNGGLQLTCTIKTYIYSICRNLWLMRLKKNQRTTTLQEYEEFVDVDDDVLDSIESTEQSSVIAQLLDQLGGDCKKVLIYFYYEKMKMAQITEIMGYKNPQIAKNKRLRCMNRLRKMALEHSGFEQFFG